MTKNKHALIKACLRSKFKRHHKSKIKGFEYNTVNTTLRYGSFGLKILKPVKLTQKNVDAFRSTIARKKLLKKKQHTMWVRGLLNTPVTRKPNEIRMGKGKGSVHHWIMKLKPGKIFVELSNMSQTRANRIFKAITSALGVPGQLVILTNKKIKFRYGQGLLS
jgi:large subunit ribosomal protein L16